MIKFIVLVVIIWVTVSIAFAQNKLLIISGVVLDSASEQSLPFVTIQIKGKAIGRSSDEAGYFSITAQVNDTLVFTRLGYHQYLFRVARENNNLIIRLIENAFLLREAIIYNSYQPYGSEKWKGDVKPIKQITFKASPTLEPRVIIRFGGKNKTKIKSTIVYDSTVNSVKVKKHLMDLYSISEETYFKKLEEFNKKNMDVAFLTKQDEITLRLIQFFALKEP